MIATPTLSGLSGTIASTSVTYTASDVSGGGSKSVSYAFYVNGESITGMQSSRTFTVTSTHNVTKSVKVQARDTAGNVSGFSNTLSFTPDVQGPATVTITSPASPSNDVTPTWTWNNIESGATYRVRISSNNGASYPNFGNWSTSRTYTNTLSSDGSYKIQVQSRDSLGNEGTIATSSSYILDTTAQGVPTPYTASPTSDRTPTWTWISIGGAVAYSLKLDGVSKGTTSSTSYTATTLSEGNHTLQVASIDSAGNISAFGSSNVTIDVTPPSVPVISTTSNPTNDRTPTFNWSSVSGAVLYGVKLNTNAETTQTATSYTPTTNLNSGTHLIKVRSKDSAGNWSVYGTLNIVIDTIPPLTPILTGPETTNDKTPTWNWDYESGVSFYELKLNNIFPKRSSLPDGYKSIF